MRRSRLPVNSAVAAISSALALAGCGSSAATATSPSNVTRCTVALHGGGTLPAQGGSATIDVSAARECSWTASTEGPWLKIESGTSGQGDGAVKYAASPNPDPAMRRGAVILNDQRLEVAQAAAACAFSLGQTSASFPRAGGGGRFEIRASSPLCPWSADPDADWIVVRTREGSGTAEVPFDVLPMTGGLSRTGAIRTAGLSFAVTQSEACAFTITPASHAAGAAGASGSISIATMDGCEWTASSSVSWLTFSPVAGTGPGVVSFSVAPSTGTARTGTGTVAGQTFTVTQSSAPRPAECHYGIETLAHTVPAGGGRVTVRVETADACAWNAASTVPWIGVIGASSFTGAGSVSFEVAPAAADRTGTVTVAGQAVSITQASGCTYTVAPTSLAVPAAGGARTVAVTAASGCGWTATSHADWITITAGASGSGNGAVAFQASALSAGSRSSTMTVAGQTVTVTQSAPSCTFGIAPERQTVQAAGGTAAVTVSAPAGCAWTASSNAPWMSVSPGAGSGDGTVQVVAGANTGGSRTGTATVAGRTFTVQQAATCTYDVQPTAIDRNWREWTIRIHVTAASGCAWTASTDAEWLTITSGASGSGDGGVDLVISENSGAERTDIVRVAGKTVVVMQRGR